MTVHNLDQARMDKLRKRGLKADPDWLHMEFKIGSNYRTSSVEHHKPRKKAFEEVRDYISGIEAVVKRLFERKK